MPDSPHSFDLLAAIDAACDRYESAWQTADGADGPPCEAYADELPEAVRDDALDELFALERQYRARGGQNGLEWAEGRPRLERLVQTREDEAPTLPGPATQRASDGALQLRCPQCREQVELAVDAPLDEVVCGACGAKFGLLGDGQEQSPSVGRFQLRERLGMGAFGAVWRARDPELDREVAIKLPRRGVLTPHQAEMFFREARAAAQLAHPGIVSVYEVGRDAERTRSMYIVSELVDGVPLSDRLKGWRPTPREAAALVADIADALEYAHGRGVIHRDLKPSNIMLDRFATGGETATLGADLGRPRLMDFGLAKRDSGELTMTVDGQVLGTPAYMSPEQARGDVHWVDRRTDLYALGVVLFRLLTGELPFRGSASAQIEQRLTDDAPNPRRLDPTAPQDLATVCLKCLERDPNRRYGAAADVVAEMRRYLAGEPVHARPLSAWGRAGRWARRRPATAAALALGAVLAVVGPTAAVVIGTQAADLRAEQAEQVESLKRLEAEIDRLEAASEAARREGPRLVETQSIPSWRRQLARSVVELHGPAMLAAVNEGTDVATQREAKVALARLLLVAGRVDEAEQLLADAEPNAGELRIGDLAPAALISEFRKHFPSEDLNSGTPQSILALAQVKKAVEEFGPSGGWRPGDLPGVVATLLGD